jgi:hypothetical protein
MAAGENSLKSKNLVKYGVVIAALMCVSLTALGCHNPIIPGYAANKDVLYFRDFALNAESVNLYTRAEGTIFIRGDRKK